MARSRQKQVGVDPRVAAYRDYERYIVNAWKSEFQQALQRAASHLPSTKPRTEGDRRAVADLIKSLQKLHLGRPLGRRLPGIEPDLISIRKSDFIRMLAAAAERAAAQLVREGQQLWRKENGRPRVPASETTKLIAEAIKRFSFQWRAPPERISADEIRRQLSKK